MTFGFALLLGGFLLLDAGWKGVTPIQVLKGVTEGTKGPGGVLKETGREVKEGVTRTPASKREGGSTEAPLTPNSKGYVNPIPKSATTGRIDQGVDFGGTGVVRAVGKAKIVRVGAPGWPGGEHGILYQLLEGPARGKFIYVYEGIEELVHEGQIVAAGHPIGRIIPGSETGIETGWSNANGEPISHSEYTEGKETVGGKSFKRFLESLGL